MTEQMTTNQAAQRYNKNPLVGQTQKDTLENCVELLDFLQDRGGDMHSGWNMNFALIRDGLGHAMGQAAVETSHLGREQ